jgi:outer membrane protein assembly factor BamB
MPKLAFTLVALTLGWFVLGCGPGDIASDGSGFGGTGTADDQGDATNTSMSDPDPSAGATIGSESDGPEPDTETDTETETETGANDWTDPETETETGDEPEPIDADCSLVWTHLDPQESHGHIGATPIGPGPNGGFVSVTPVLTSDDGVNVDARIRSWLPSGEVLWDQQISWADHRDDPLALLTDELDDVYLAGRINANTFEDAMIAKLDGASGELVWTFLRGEAGGYSSIAYNGAALVVAGMIDGLGLELVALEPDTGEVLWGSGGRAPSVSKARGLVVANGSVDVLVSGSGAVELLRYDPPAIEPSTLASLPVPLRGGGIAPQDLERLGDGSLAALYNNGSSSFLAIVDHQTGELLELRELDEFPQASSVMASELTVLPADTGFGIAGTITIGQDQQTFVVRLDAALETSCSGVLSKVELGIAWPPELRGLAVGDDGALYTGSYVVTSRRGVYARWD